MARRKARPLLDIHVVLVGMVVWAQVTWTSEQDAHMARDANNFHTIAQLLQNVRCVSCKFAMRND